MTERGAAPQRIVRDLRRYWDGRTGKNRVTALGTIMNEAVHTTASPAAIWLIVIIMPIMTMILIIAPAVADSRQARVDRRAWGAGQLGPAIADVLIHAGALGADTADADTADADMTSAGRTDAGAPAAGASKRAAEGMSRDPVPAQWTEPPTGEQPAAGQPVTAERPA